jgi:hypothetical protein
MRPAGRFLFTGGGGGDGSAAPSTAGSPAAAAAASLPVSVSLRLPVAISEDLFQGDTLPGLQAEVVLDGELQAMAGRTLFLIMEDPASLFVNPPNVVFSDVAPRATLTAQGRALDQPGQFTGQVRLHACLEASCTSELKGSPLTVPFDVRVRSGMVLSEQQFSVTVPFGELPARRTVQVKLPESVIEWGASTSTPMPTIYDPRPKLRASVTPSTPAATGTVFLDLLPAVPGTYVETAQVGVDIAGILGAPQQRKTITVTYTVTPNDAIDIAFFPASGSLTWKTGTFPQMSLDRRSWCSPACTGRSPSKCSPRDADHPAVNPSRRGG